MKKAILVLGFLYSDSCAKTDIKKINSQKSIIPKIKKVFSIFFLTMFLFVGSGQAQSFYSSADVLSFLNENSFSNNSTTIKFSQNGAFLKIGNSLFNNPSIRVVSNTTAYVKYFSLNNPSISASLIVEKNGSYIIDRSSNTKYEMYSAFDQLERIRLGKNYNETSEERGKRLYQERIDGIRIERENEEKYRIKMGRIVYHPEGEVNEKKDTSYTSGFRNKYNREKKKFIDLAGNKIGFDVIDVGNKFIEIGNVFPDTINYLEAQNILKKAGGGWRLPTKNEMQGIIDFSPPKWRNEDTYIGLSLNYYWTSTKVNEKIWNAIISNYQYIYKGGMVLLSKEEGNSFIPVRDVQIKSLKPLYDYYFIGDNGLIDGQIVLKNDFKIILEKIKKNTEFRYISQTVFDEKKIINTSGKFYSNEDVLAFLNESLFSNDNSSKSYKFSEKGTSVTTKFYGDSSIYNNPIIESRSKESANITYSLIKDPRKKIKITAYKYEECINNYGEIGRGYEYKRKVDIGKINSENWVSYLNDIFKENVNGKDSVKIKSMKFEVCQYIYPNKLSFNQHQKIIKIIGNGWRLPTAFEFLIIYILNQDRSNNPELEYEYSRYQKVVKVDFTGSQLFLINNDGERLISGGSFFDKEIFVGDFYKKLGKYEPKDNINNNVNLILVRSVN